MPEVVPAARRAEVPTGRSGPYREESATELDLASPRCAQSAWLLEDRWPQVGKTRRTDLNHAIELSRMAGASDSSVL